MFHFREILTQFLVVSQYVVLQNINPTFKLFHDIYTFHRFWRVVKKCVLTLFLCVFAFIKCSSEEFNLCPSIDREVTSITLSVWVLEICQLPIVQVCKMKFAWTEEIDYVSGLAKLQPKTRVVDTIKKTDQLIYIREESR